MTELRDQLQATLSGAYTLERELGGGGMSRVFVAEDTRLRRKVVVKVLSPELTQGMVVERFEREIQTAAALQQANIVPLLSAGDTNGLPYYTMPFVEGESLRARLARGPLSVTEVIGVLRDVSKALAYAHRQGVVHRDIKPDNVLLSEGTAVVTDFGIAKAISAARTGSGNATLTQIGTSIGTPAYMAPEQAAGDPSIDHRADIYSLGAMAYELLAGQPVFAGRTPQRMLAAHMAEAPRPITELRPDLPQSLADIVMSSLAKEADDRPQSASDITRVLESITSGSGMQSMPHVLLGGAAMFRRALAFYAAAFVAVAVVAKAAIVGIGLPDWVFSGSLIVMALGLPVVLWTGYVQRVVRRAARATPTFTPGGTPSTTAHGAMATMALRAAPHVSWYRTARGGMYALGAFIVIIAAFMVMRAFGIGPAGSLFAKGALKENERLLVADFGVKSGADTALGSEIAEAVRTDLAQSNALRVVPSSAIRASLQRMQKPVDARLDPVLAKEMAQRDGIRALVVGDITSAGTGFIVTVRLVSSETGDELAAARETAAGPTELIRAADLATRDLRGKIGESLKHVQASPPLEKVTTSSLEALRKYGEGVRAFESRDYLKAVQGFREAVAIDTAFAMAWRKLAFTLGNGGFPQSLRDAAADRAYQFRDRLPEDERYAVIGVYFQTGRGRDRAKALAAWDVVVAHDRWDLGGTNVGNIYRDRREWARADSAYRREIASDEDPPSRDPYTGLITILGYDGKFSAAESVAAEMVKRVGPGSSVPIAVYVAYDKGQLDSARRALEAFRGDRTPARRTSALIALSTLALVQGRLKDAATDRSTVVSARTAAGAPVDSLGETRAAAAVVGFQREQPEQAVQLLDKALAKWPLEASPVEDRQYLALATDYANYGRADRARALMSRYQADVRDTSLLRVREPALHSAQAAIALAEKRPLDAIKEYRLADLRPDGPVASSPLTLYANIGRAFDRAGQTDSAIAYFQRYLTTPQLDRIAVDASNIAGIRERLAQLYENKGNAEKAVEYYRAFIELWKNADADLQPRVAAARERLRKLTPVEKSKS